MFPRFIVFGLLLCHLPSAAAEVPAAPTAPATPAASPPAASPATEEAKPLQIASTDEPALKAAVGQLATVRGKVKRANAWEGGITFLNFDGAFTAVVFKKHYGAFPSPPEQLYAAGKSLEVTGKLALHKGNVQIEITRPDQVKVLETAAPAENPAPATAPETSKAPPAGETSPAKP